MINNSLPVLRMYALLGVRYLTLTHSVNTDWADSSGDKPVHNGLTEVRVGQFPNILCTDQGRAINQGEPGWENTLTGIPKEIYQLWRDYLQPRGYKLHYQIIEFPGGMPGDVGITLSWH